MSRPTKKEVREWLKRIREDVANCEKALKDGNWSQVYDCAEDASGSAGEIMRLTEEN